MARVLFALPFVASGVIHFARAEAMAVAVPIPGGMVWVYITGAAMIAAGIGLLTRKFGTWAALGLALLLVTFIVTMHLPGLARPEMRSEALTNLIKDTGLLAGALTWAGLLASNEQ